MKTLIAIITGLSLVSLSCSTVLHTPDQVLERYKTKKDVSVQFGLPTEKKTTDTTEEWLYTYERKHPHYIVEDVNTSTVNVTEFKQHKRYLIFYFDKKENVVRTEYKNVDLTERKKSVGKTVALVLGLVAIFIIGLTIAYNAAGGFYD